MKLEVGKFCPLIGKDCIQTQCSWFTQIRGTDPQSGKDVDEWGCAVTWMPMLLIENSQKQRETGAAVESFRNEVVERTSEQFLPIVPVRVETDTTIDKIIEGS
tara:strand:+ start:132 stop:440 length:309 start_codon:yes stop_codon:yes gene_type:complete